MTPRSSSPVAPVLAPARESMLGQASVGTRHRHLRAVQEPVARPVLPLTREVHSAGTAVRGRLSRFVGGTYSPTVERIRFVDGRTALTDLIRLNPGVDAYSVDLDGVAPQAVSRYRPAPWADVAVPGAGDRDDAVVRLLSASYPAVDLATLSERVRAAGRPLGRAQCEPTRRSPRPRPRSGTSRTGSTSIPHQRRSRGRCARSTTVTSWPCGRRAHAGRSAGPAHSNRASPCTSSSTSTPVRSSVASPWECFTAPSLRRSGGIWSAHPTAGCGRPSRHPTSTDSTRRTVAGCTT